MRPLFVTGTDTGIGKTRVTYGLASGLRKRHIQTQTWKPVQTGVRTGTAEADSFRLKWGSGAEEEEAHLVSVTLPDPLAPWMAARRRSMKLDYEQLVEEGRQRASQTDLLIMEGAGGLLVPLTEKQLIADLAIDLEMSVLIVARAGLGTVNHTLLTIEAARSRGLQVAGIVINGMLATQRPEVQENREMIEHFGQCKVLGLLPDVQGEPETTSPADWQSWKERWDEVCEQNLDWTLVLGLAKNAGM
ncbi:dethiobiotin synthase [Marinicrinis sediminis]|uniref:ATP-dependent dethiobiotin synthetase BioD n=1 Tax=Marinicrinis sediminis TaxID=1652465 RepID=A0ABW5REP7_9BACL